ncbi:MAG: hypothetical protein R6V58_16760, partial [Planctomycetota bacterium]
VCAICEICGLSTSDNLRIHRSVRSCKGSKALRSMSPNFICWDVPPRGRRVRLNETGKKYKFTVEEGGREMPVYVLRRMEGIRVLSTRELRDRGVRI